MASRINVKITSYRITHKGYGCKDDLNLLKSDDLNVRFSFLLCILNDLKKGIVTE